MINFSEPYQSYKENKSAFDKVIIKTLIDGSYILGVYSYYIDLIETVSLVSPFTKSSDIHH